jgi:hypothetical protein
MGGGSLRKRRGRGGTWHPGAVSRLTEAKHVWRRSTSGKKAGPWRGGVVLPKGSGQPAGWRERSFARVVSVRGTIGLSGERRRAAQERLPFFTSASAWSGRGTDGQHEKEDSLTPKPSGSSGPNPAAGGGATAGVRRRRRIVGGAYRDQPPVSDADAMRDNDGDRGSARRRTLLGCISSLRSCLPFLSLSWFALSGLLPSKLSTPHVSRNVFPSLGTHARTLSSLASCSHSLDPLSYDPPFYIPPFRSSFSPLRIWSC